MHGRKNIKKFPDTFGIECRSKNC